MKPVKESSELAEELKQCQKVLTAIGDETRQEIIIRMIACADDCSGLRVPEITAMTNLSRPAVSYHLRILKNAGILAVRKQGTRNYYYFESGEAIEKLIQTLQHADRIIQTLPDRSGEQWMEQNKSSMELGGK